MDQFGVPIGTGTSWSIAVKHLERQVQGVLKGFKGDQEVCNAQNMVSFNSPDDKLSNGTPHDIIWRSYWDRYKLVHCCETFGKTGTRGFKGVLGGPGCLKCPKYGFIQLS